MYEVLCSSTSTEQQIGNKRPETRKFGGHGHTVLGQGGKGGKKDIYPAQGVPSLKKKKWLPQKVRLSQEESATAEHELKLSLSWGEAGSATEALTTATPHLSHSSQGCRHGDNRGAATTESRPILVLKARSSGPRPWPVGSFERLCVP